MNSERKNKMKLPGPQGLKGAVHFNTAFQGEKVRSKGTIGVYRELKSFLSLCTTVFYEPFTYFKCLRDKFSSIVNISEYC